VDVPYYAQTAEFSCGPACLLMAMRVLDPRVRLTRAAEFEVWRDCNMVGVRGADPYGLSVPLLKAGHEVVLVAARRDAIDAAAWERRLAKGPFTREDMRLALFAAGENRRRAKRLGLRVRRAAPTIAAIEAAMRQGFVALVLAHMGVVHGWDIPHWVVVSGVSATEVTFNDPYPPKGRKGNRLTHALFRKMAGDVAGLGMTPAVVLARRPL
jgi:hypothetical protein